MAANTNPYDAERSAILGYFQSIFIDQTGATDTGGSPLPFLPFEIPGRRIDQPSTPWARVTFQAGRPFAREVGTDATRTAGFFTVEIFMPENTGTLISRQAAQVVRAAYALRQLAIPTGRIRFFEVGIRDTPSVQTGFGKANIEVAYWTDMNAWNAIDPLFNDPTNAARGYILIGNPPAPLIPPSTLGLATTSNAALDTDGNIILRNTTTGAFGYLVIQGQPGAESVLSLDEYNGAHINLSTDAAGNMLIFNETTNVYEYIFLRGAAGQAAVVASAAWVLPGLNWNKDGEGNLLLFNVTTATYVQVSFQGQAGQQTLQPIQ
jgi:hypothetical protein